MNGCMTAPHEWISKCVAIVKAAHQAEFERTFAAEIKAGLLFVCSDDDWILNEDDGRIAPRRLLSGG